MAPLARFDLRSALANGLVAIEELLFAVHKAWCERAADFEGAGHGFHFLLAEFASTPAGEYAIVLVHKFLLDGCYAITQDVGKRGSPEATPFT
jgi:hypothetical protein